MYNRTLYKLLSLYHAPYEPYEPYEPYAIACPWLCEVSSQGGTRSLARDVPVERLTVTEGSLKIVAIDQLEHLRDAVTPATQRVLKIFLDRETLSRRRQPEC